VAVLLAVNLVEEMPFQPSEAMLGGIMAAWQVHGEVDTDFKEIDGNVSFKERLPHELGTHIQTLAGVKLDNLPGRRCRHAEPRLPTHHFHGGYGKRRRPHDTCSVIRILIHGFYL
jgi:hypothetical protein